MSTFKITGERYTLASALRPELETLCDEDEFISCTLKHPMDDHIELIVPREELLRKALLQVKDRIQTARLQCKRTVHKTSAATAKPA